MSLEEYKTSVENYLLQSVSLKEARRLMQLYEEDFEMFFKEKLDISVTGTAILMGY